MFEISFFRALEDTDKRGSILQTNNNIYIGKQRLCTDTTIIVIIRAKDRPETNVLYRFQNKNAHRTETDWCSLWFCFVKYRVFYLIFANTDRPAVVYLYKNSRSARCFFSYILEACRHKSTNTRSAANKRAVVLSGASKRRVRRNANSLLYYSLLLFRKCVLPKWFWLGFNNEKHIIPCVCVCAVPATSSPREP